MTFDVYQHYRRVSRKGRDGRRKAFWMSRDDADALERASLKERASQNDILRRALRAFLCRHRKQE